MSIFPDVPQPIIALALTCHAFNAVVSSSAFKARIFRLMFDVGAINRRLFHPRDSDLANELQQCCYLLNSIRKGDIDSSEDSIAHSDEALVSSYFLMLCHGSVETVVTNARS